MSSVYKFRVFPIGPIRFLFEFLFIIDHNIHEVWSKYYRTKIISVLNINVLEIYTYQINVERERVLNYVIQATSKYFLKVMNDNSMNSYTFVVFAVFFTFVKLEQRVSIEFRVELGKSETETFEIIKKTFKAVAMSRS